MFYLKCIYISNYIYLFRNSTNVRESFSEHYKDSASTTSQCRSCTVKSSVSGSKHDNSSLYGRQWRVTGTHPWIMKMGGKTFSSRETILHVNSTDTCTSSSVKLHLAVPKHRVSLSHYSAPLKDSSIPIAEDVLICLIS